MAECGDRWVHVFDMSKISEIRDYGPCYPSAARGMLAGMTKNSRAKVGQRCMAYVANGTETVRGIYTGKRKDTSVAWAPRVFSVIKLDNGEIYETILPVYAD